MPNHITSIVHIESVYDEDASNYDEQETKIRDLYKRLHTEESNFDLNAGIKMPSNIYRGDLTQEKRREYGENNWYDWCSKNWGTKWNSYGVVYLDDYKDGEHIFGEILVKIETAWAPPIPVFKALASQGFSVRYTWKDEGDDTWIEWAEA